MLGARGRRARPLRAGCCAGAPATTGGPSARTRSRRRRVGIDTFWWKMRAVVLSAAMTAVAGVFFAFYYNSLFPEQIFSFTRSIEIILGPVIGGLGTLFGPIVGAAALVAARRRHHGVLAKARASTYPAPSRSSMAWCCCSSPSTCRTGSGRRSRARSASNRRSSDVPLLGARRRQQVVSRPARGCARDLRGRAPGTIVRAHRAERRRQDDALQPDRRRASAGPRRHPACDGRSIARPAAARGLRGRRRPHVPAGQAVRGPVRPRQRDGGRASRRTHGRRRARARAAPCSNASASPARRRWPPRA